MPPLAASEYPPAHGWKRPVPVSVGTVGFTVLTGFALSFPVGLLLPEAWRRVIPAPEELRFLVLSLDVLSIAAVPLWTVLLWPPPRRWVKLLLVCLAIPWCLLWLSSFALTS